eukprot:COSAG02_NODE_24977_length_672_cov_0.975567_1_plen_107_part_10
MHQLAHHSCLGRYLRPSFLQRIHFGSSSVPVLYGCLLTRQCNPTAFWGQKETFSTGTGSAIHSTGRLAVKPSMPCWLSSQCQKVDPTDDAVDTAPLSMVSLSTNVHT